MAQNIAAAERRIEAVRRERRDSLDLSGLRLRTVPASVADLTWLRKLELNDNWLSGLPDSLAGLDSLTHLDLANNWLPEVPGWIAGLRGLTWLVLDDNKIIEVPSWIGDLTKLTGLGLSGCGLDTVPEWIAGLGELTELDLENNHLTEIPESLGDHGKLTLLGLAGNRLRALPASLERLTKLTGLSLGRNQLTELPDWIGRLEELIFLDIGGNDLTEIPGWLGNLTGLTHINLSGCRLTEVPRWLARLTSLSCLNLTGNWLAEIPEWLSDLTELAILLLGGNRLQTLPETLGHLTKLAHLNIDRNRLSVVPPWIRLLTGLIRLDLGKNQFDQVPDWIGDLTGLTSLLYIYNNQFSKIPDTARTLTRLQWLWLAHNKLTELPRWLASLTKLSHLFVNYNRLTWLPSELETLANLTYLDLSGNRLTDIPDWLANMTGLTELDIGYNSLNEVSDRIGNLTSLTALRLGKCNLTEVPPWVIRLTRLNVIDLSDNTISSFPDFISKLTRLQFLLLGKNKITAIPEGFRGLTALWSLVLYGNKISGLPDWIGELAGITYLNLSINDLAKLPESLQNLSGLRMLDLAGNKLAEAPDWLLDLPALETLRLGGNPTLVSPPPEIAASGTESVLAFLKARREGATRQWVSKLLVVGEGGVGKTSLIKALTGAEHDPAEETTHGIRVKDLLLQHPDEPGVRMKLSTWDFGGQQIYHATHQFFLTDRSLFLLLWNARLGWEQGRLHYWLDIIKSRAPESPVLLIATHADASQRPADLPVDDLRREYPQIAGCLVMDNDTRRGIADVRDALARHAADLPLMGAEWPTTWLNAADAVKAYPENRITPELMWQIMAEAGVTDPDQQRYIAVAMHQLGDILYYHDDPELVQTVVLNPEWVNGYISEVLDSPEVDKSLGLLTHAEMTRLWSGLDRGMRDHFLGMMDKYEISFRVDDKPAGVVSLVVERLPWNPPSYEDEWNEPLAAPGTSEIRVIYQLNTMPPGIPTWFIARSHRFTTNVHWRTGAVLAHPDGKHKALLRANPRRNRVELTVRGPAPAAFFSVLDDGFNRTLERYPGLEIKRLVPCPCGHNGTCTEEFEYDDLQKRLGRQPPRHEIECRKSGEDVNVPQLLHGLSPSERDTTRAGIERLTTMVGGIVDDLVDQREYTQRMFLKLLRVTQDQQEVRCPSVFSVVPVKHRVTGTRLALRLYCEEPGAWHPIPDDAGCYEVNEAADWLQKIKPHLSQLLTVLKHAAPLAGPVLGMTVAHMSDHMKAEIATMTELVSQIPEPSRIPDPLDKDELRRDPGVSDRAGNDADFRVLEALLLKLDPAREWGGLSRTVTPEGLTLYLCREHYETYRRAVRL